MKMGSRLGFQGLGFRVMVPTNPRRRSKSTFVRTPPHRKLQLSRHKLRKSSLKPTDPAAPAG